MILLFMGVCLVAILYDRVIACQMPSYCLRAITTKSNRTGYNKAEKAEWHTGYLVFVGAVVSQIHIGYYLNDTLLDTVVYPVIRTLLTGVIGSKVPGFIHMPIVQTRKKPTMVSMAYRWLDTSVPLWYRPFVSGIVIGLSSVFALPRIDEPWFLYAVIAFPAAMAAMIWLVHYLSNAHKALRVLSSEICSATDQVARQPQVALEPRPREHVLVCLMVASGLALMSLIITGNTSWTRYVDAAGVFYLGLVAGDIVYLLVGIPRFLAHMVTLPVVLNPLDPANTAELRALIGRLLSVLLVVSGICLSINAIVALASLLFPHLRWGVFALSFAAWGVILVIGVRPHLLLWQLIQQAKNDTLDQLESLLKNHYQQLLEGTLESSTTLDTVLKLHEHMTRTANYPLAQNTFVSILTTSIVNGIPIAVSFFPI